jgi:hypothetical protein
MKKILVFISFILSFFLCQAQKIEWNLSTGLNYSTINNIQNGQQVVLVFEKNAPGYKLYPQLGISGRIKLHERLNSNVGLKWQRVGDKLGTNEFSTVDTVYSIYMDYLTVPFNFEIRMLPQKNIYWIGGLSANIFLRSSKLKSLAIPFVESFKDRLGLQFQTGIKVDFNSKIGGQLLLCKGVTNTNTKLDFLNKDRLRYQLMFAEGTIFYRFNTK